MSLVASWSHHVSKSTIRHYPHAKQTVWKEHHWNFDSKRSKWVWRRNEDGYREKHLIPSVKYGGGSVIAWIPDRTWPRPQHLKSGISVWCSSIREKLSANRNGLTNQIVKSAFIR